jgi:hypothetical protein
MKIEDCSTEIIDIDEIIYQNINDLFCSYGIIISHRTLMDLGIKPFLKSIAYTLVSYLQANSVFGKYIVSFFMITGKQIRIWLTEINSIYSKFICTTLKSEILSLIYTKQLKTHMIMAKSIVNEDHFFNYKQLKREKFQQVLSKKFFIEILPTVETNLQVYEDKGNYYEKISSTQFDGCQTWRILISDSGKDKILQDGIKKRFYINLNWPKSKDPSCSLGN